MHVHDASPATNTYSMEGGGLLEIVNFICVCGGGGGGGGGDLMIHALLW